jgi:hypothetical protein
LPNPAQVGFQKIVHVPSGNVVVLTNTNYLMTFDGVSMSPALQLPPAASGKIWDVTQTSDGRYHVFHDAQELVSDLQGGWLPDAPIPLPAIGVTQLAAAAMSNDRIVVAYTDLWFNAADPVHVHVLSHAPGANWTAVQDITPQWAVRAQHLNMMGPHDGGLIIAADGESQVGAIWRSPDGLTFGNWEDLGGAPIDSVHANCLADATVVTGYQTSASLIANVGGSWTKIDTQLINYIDSSKGVVLPNGKTYWAMGETFRGEYRASP